MPSQPFPKVEAINQGMISETGEPLNTRGLGLGSKEVKGEATFFGFDFDFQLDRVEAWPVELRNSTGWSSRRSSWSSRWLLPSSFACPVELLPCAKSLHAPHVPYAPECSKRPISKDQTCICMQMQPKTNMNA
ncbi:unnamed protein product [Microthlaspi erraticum]|uniref:Uncharacterized protein n=1 Tax=Microthlaspi erraticum TaxID=1685480 RepID=A0A6D2K312_9BRAS|nr:unnamed protein product [Microthlaspi erraticum]